MAMLIVDTCISCAACESECPNHAISDGDPIFVIDAEKCTECVGAFDEPQCMDVCPADCIVPDPGHEESKEQLMEKYHRMHG